MKLKTLESDASPEAVLAALEEDGALIVRDLIDREKLDQVLNELRPLIDGTPMGRDDFVGRKTRRTGALVARAPSCRDLVTHKRTLACAEAFLAPFTDRILLHLTQAITIGPGGPAQPLHRDRLAWGTHIPLSVEPQFNTLWALTDFTTENGATRCVPGSHRWEWKRRALPEEMVQAEMTAGSVFIYSGSVLHGGGQNRAASDRVGLNLTYTLGWLRQEENQYLSCPPSIAKDLDTRLQELLGYTQGTYAIGYYSDPFGRYPGKDILPPEAALGRKAPKGTGFGDPNEKLSELLSGDQI